MNPIEEAIALSRTGHARGLDAHGRAVFSAHGTPFGASPRKRRKRSKHATVMLNWRDGKIGARWAKFYEAHGWRYGGAVYPLHQLPKSMKADLELVRWASVDPVSVVDMLAEV